ncbi:PucR family transcriptional regulator [Nakamurella flava]|uniref:PucR family transcriptional regulator n=1 Tax=Nakamurella flava TaxID=2576308 RepID=UPI001408DF0F|nr:PucR family transcriptional regulator [Nakamurella flava]
MTLSVVDLVGRPALGLRWATAGTTPPERGGRPVTWVHTSELDDPTPFLAGGEVLLTTGLTRAPDDDATNYVDRLVAVGVVGLGFGTGLNHATVPPALVRAAAAAGLPLFEVPRATPFIAISRAVSRAIAADEYAAVQRTFTAQQALTRAAQSDTGVRRVVRLLARQVAGSVVLLDADGAVLETAPALSPARAGVLRTEVRGLRGHAGAVGVAFAAGTDSISLQSVGGGRGRTFLAVARGVPLTPDDRHLVNAAVLLLTIRQERATGSTDGPERVPAAVLARLLDDPAPSAREWAESVLAASGAALPVPPWTVAVADRPPSTGWADLGADGLVGERHGRPVLLLGAAGGRTVPVRSGAGDQGAARWGLSRATSDPTALPGAVREADEALAVGHRTGAAVTRFDDLVGTGWSALVPPDRAAAWAAGLLAPIRDHRPAAVTAPDGAELLRSLRAWLLHHGQWDPAAADLGVHRHTLRKRIVLIEGLLGRSLEAPGVRAELWLALAQGGGG